MGSEDDLNLDDDEESKQNFMSSMMNRNSVVGASSGRNQNSGRVNVDNLAPTSMTTSMKPGMLTGLLAG